MAAPEIFYYLRQDRATESYRLAPMEFLVSPGLPPGPAWSKNPPSAPIHNIWLGFLKKTAAEAFLF